MEPIFANAMSALRQRYVCDLPRFSWTFCPVALSFVYTVEYECGFLKGENLFAIAGSYRTDIMIHNPTDKDQTFVIKFFMLQTSGLKFSPPVWSEAYVIMPGGAADIDCYDIWIYTNADLLAFSKGLVIISHLLNGPKVPLDVIVAYTFATSAGASKQVLLVPGVYVSKVPIPPIIPPT